MKILVLKFIALILITNAYTKAKADEDSVAIPYNVLELKEKNTYDCENHGVPWIICVDHRFSQSAKDRLIGSFLNFFALSLLKIEKMNQCFSKTDQITKIRNEMKSPRYSNSPTCIFFTPFQHESKIIDAHLDFFNTVQRREPYQGYFSIGINQNLIGAAEHNLGSSKSYWTAMIALGILRNLGVREDITENSVSSHFSRCFLFAGEIPKNYQPSEPFFSELF